MRIEISFNIFMKVFKFYFLSQPVEMNVSCLKFVVFLFFVSFVLLFQAELQQTPQVCAGGQHAPVIFVAFVCLFTNIK